MRNLPETSTPTGTDQQPIKREQISGGVQQSVRHESAERHVSGEALFTDDRAVPAGTLFAYVGLASIARGKILSMDLSRVLAAEGVVSVVTLEDIPGHRDIGPVFPGDPVFADGEVLFHGQPLFAVAATSQTLARRAARLAQVDYEPWPADLTIEQGLAAQSFVRPSHTQRRGDAAAAIAGAPRRLSDRMHIGGQEQMYLEGQVSLACPDEEGGITLYTSNQNPTEVQKLIAEVLAIPISMVTVDMRRMGGGFGGKETNANQWAVIASLLARKTGRAVKVRLARADDMTATGKRHHFVSDYDVGFDDQGLIQGLDMSLSAGCGYSPDLSDAIVDRAMFHADNAYFLPTATITGHRVKTDTVSNTAFRGFGGPQGMVAIECVMDDIARAVGRDPLDVRKDNLYGPEGGRDTTHYGQTIERHILPGLIEQLEQTSDYRQRRQDIAAFNRSQPILRKGLALTPVKFGISFTAQHLNQAGALLHVYTDGSIQLNHGGTEMGQGLFTKVAQIVATVLQVDMARILPTATRTDKVPNTSPTAASSGTDLNGMAARNAAETIKQRLTDFAAEHFQTTSERVRFHNNRVYIAEDQVLSFGELAQLAYLHRISLSATGYYRTPKIYYDREQAQGHPFFYYANGAAVSEVLVDTLTGEYRVTRVDILQDVGQSLNPALDIGQIEGAYIQGMGWLTTEELVWGGDGRLQTNSPASYKIPAIGDTPAEFNVALLADSPNVEATIFHSKAVGEPPLMLSISVWSALRDAIASLADYQLSPRLDTPATPERVLNAINSIKAITTLQQQNRGAS
ncbi:xanthine dehydrogenase molybdopterin binding subunit [Aestuariicella hydrocarbonica]|uniref:Xanthine dehydrogenase molybdopterin binding subunit n=1 Tax=Pseudomaricurvus hydrocarbonicus TaxID=1470433 RepID=A0A9E5K0E6_9GAMM|nr:xanthine dehydrogenase molybdopterin binding subunit [Aestuariicella hydrocarbonica]NHO66242.1 xanthine dehydrogenase molybdopterin binding subunit [Aestuariicella hydrocarbonica]